MFCFVHTLRKLARPRRILLSPSHRFPFALCAAPLAGILLATPATSQSYTNIYDFSAVAANPEGALTNGDGGNSYAGLILYSNVLYGTTSDGGMGGSGTVFKINTDATGFSTLYSFSAYDATTLTNRDGSAPQAALFQAGQRFYGTTSAGGFWGVGTVFGINMDGTAFTNLHSFSGGNDGGSPFSPLTGSGNSLFGTTYEGGETGFGTIFAMQMDGTGLTNLHSFPAVDTNNANADGAYPLGGLVLAGNILYGTASTGGDFGFGTIFALNTDGSSFTILHHFTGGNDGALPEGNLILSGNVLYGTTVTGGVSGNGTIFAVGADGSGFTNLYGFSATDTNDYNADGAEPGAGLLIVSNILYGTTTLGGDSGTGTLFQIATNGADFSVLHQFGDPSISPSDGDQPFATLVNSGNTLYGTTSAGGLAGSGTVFEFSPPPPATNYPDGIFGFLTDMNGSPITGVNIYAQDTNGNALYSTTDNNGYYVLFVPDGTWNIAADCSQLAVQGFSCLNGATLSVCCSNSAELDFTTGLADLPLCISPLLISTTTLPPGRVGSVYDQFLQADRYLQGSLCYPVFTWTLASGALPPGLQLASSGELFGTPSNGGTFNIVVSVTDGSGNSTNQPLSINVVPNPTPLTISQPAVSQGQFQWTLTSGAGEYETIAFSTNLVDWVPLLTTNLTNGSSTFRFPISPSNQAGFYKAVQSGFMTGTQGSGSVIFPQPANPTIVSKGGLTVPISRSGNVSGQACLGYVVSVGGASIGGSYCFEPNQVTGNISIPISAINGVPGAVPITSAATNLTGTISWFPSNGGPTITSTLTINVDAPVFSFQTNIFFGNTVDGSATVTVVRNGDISGSNSVSFSTSDGTAIAGTDYISVHSNLTFLPGQQNATLAVPLLSNANPPTNLTVGLNLGAADGQTMINPTNAVLEINTGSVVEFSTTRFVASIFDSNAFVTVTRRGHTEQTVSVACEFDTNEDGCIDLAVPGIDFEMVAGYVVFGPGVTNVTFGIPLLSSASWHDTITLQLSYPSPNCALGTPNSSSVHLEHPEPVLATSTGGGPLWFEPVPSPSYGCGPNIFIITIQNAGPPGSVLPFSCQNGNLLASNLLTLNYANGSGINDFCTNQFATNLSGYLFSGESVFIGCTINTNYLASLDNEQRVELANPTVPVIVNTNTRVDIPTINVSRTLLGEWSGLWTNANTNLQANSQIYGAWTLQFNSITYNEVGSATALVDLECSGQTYIQTNISDPPTLATFAYGTTTTASIIPDGCGGPWVLVQTPFGANETFQVHGYSVQESADMYLFINLDDIGLTASGDVNILLTPFNDGDFAPSIPTINGNVSGSK